MNWEDKRVATAMDVRLAAQKKEGIQK